MAVLRSIICRCAVAMWHMQTGPPLESQTIHCQWDSCCWSLQTVRALESDRNRRASRANEEQIQARLKAVRARKQKLKQQFREWDSKQAQKLSDVMSSASARIDLPKVLEDATNTVQRHRAERVDAQIRTVALEEELKILKEQQSEAEHARMSSAGELEILKVTQPICNFLTTDVTLPCHAVADCCHRITAVYCTELPHLLTCFRCPDAARVVERAAPGAGT